MVTVCLYICMYVCMCFCIYPPNLILLLKRETNKHSSANLSQKKSNRKSAIVAIQGRKNSFRKKNAKLSHVGKEPKLHGGSMLRCLFGWDSKLLFWEALWVGEDSMEASFFGVGEQLATLFRSWTVWEY